MGSEGKGASIRDHVVFHANRATVARIPLEVGFTSESRVL